MEGRDELGGGGLQPSTFRLNVSGEYQTTTSATSGGEERIKISRRRREHGKQRLQHLENKLEFRRKRRASIWTSCSQQGPIIKGECTGWTNPSAGSFTNKFKKRAAAHLRENSTFLRTDPVLHALWEKSQIMV